jgi:hypothetical protein
MECGKKNGCPLVQKLSVGRQKATRHISERRM